MKLRKKLGTFLLALWLILTGLASLTVFKIPSGDTILATIAVVAGILIFMEIRAIPGKNLGRRLLAFWLISIGLIPLLSITFPAGTTVLAMLAVVTGVLLLLGR